MSGKQGEEVRSAKAESVSSIAAGPVTNEVKYGYVLFVIAREMGGRGGDTYSVTSMVFAFGVSVTSWLVAA